MSSARLPEHGGSPLLAAAPGLAPAPDSLPSIRPSLGAHPAHLLPCAGCGALNGRSALTCWSCEADLLAFAPFAPPGPAIAAAEPLVELVVEPEPAAPGVSAEAADGRRGLHLVSRGSGPASVQAAPALAAPEPTLDLPVLTELVEHAVLVPPERNAWHHERPMIALALAVIALLAAAGGLRWLAPPPGPEPVASRPSAPGASRADADVERPFSAPAPAPPPSAEPERASLSFPPVEAAPAAAAADPPAPTAARSRAAPPAHVVSAAHRPVPKPREIRETVSPPPAACTSNMAALGFCTLPPAAAKE